LLALVDTAIRLNCVVAIEYDCRGNRILNLDSSYCGGGVVVLVIFAAVRHGELAYEGVGAGLGGSWREDVRVERAALQPGVVEVHTDGTGISVMRAALENVVVVASDGPATLEGRLGLVDRGGERVW
jgi:hypothetical protein